MNVRETVMEAAEDLREYGIEEYRLEAELFMAEVLGVSRLEILTDGLREIDEDSRKRFNELIHRRGMGEPYAYIVGKKEFMGLEFSVGPGILIPRPDTEILVETVLGAVKKNAAVAEVGIGSGCISVSLAKYGEMRCFGTDISQIAVDTARKNAERNGVLEKTEFFLGDIFKGLPDMRFDAVVSNPPYIRKKDMDNLMRDVKEFEPRSALYGGEDGLDFYRIITRESLGILNNGGFIFYEIGYDEADGVKDILGQNGFTDIKIEKDLSGLDRVVWGRGEDFNV